MSHIPVSESTKHKYHGHIQRGTDTANLEEQGDRILIAFSFPLSRVHGLGLLPSAVSIVIDVSAFHSLYDSVKSLRITAHKEPITAPPIIPFHRLQFSWLFSVGLQHILHTQSNGSFSLFFLNIFVPNYREQLPDCLLFLGNSLYNFVLTGCFLIKNDSPETYNLSDVRICQATCWTETCTRDYSTNQAVIHTDKDASVLNIFSILDGSRVFRIKLP